jgi:hypothetical protein
VSSTPNSWRRFGIEAVVIIGSILLAFAIDAAWATRKETAEVIEALESVREELVANRDYFEGIAAAHHRVAEAGFELLTLTGPQPEIESVERIQFLIGELWYRAGLDSPGTGAAAALIASGRVSQVQDPALRQALAEWPAYVERQRQILDLIYQENRFHERMVLFVPQLGIDRLNGMGTSEVARARFRESAPEASRFPQNYEGLLSDLEFENGVTSRVTSSLIGEDEAEKAGVRIDALISQVEEHLR